MDADDFRAALAAALAERPANHLPIDHYSGIVIPAGGQLYGRLAWHLIWLLRRIGCRLPVEVWHFGHEMPGRDAELFQSLDGVRTVDVTAYCDEHGIRPRPCERPGWWLKAFAVRHCRFAQALLLDADNVPVIRPDHLFHDITYLRTGAFFWPDLPPPRARGDWVPAAAWRTVGLEPVPTARPFESGQLLVDRTRHIHALDLAVLLNEWSEVTYRVVYGDKDCWLLAWHLAGARYHMPARNPVWREPAICQHDSAGQLVFQHACQAKAELAAGEVIPSLVHRRFACDAARAWADLHGAQ
jgi:hypothetical protein